MSVLTPDQNIHWFSIFHINQLLVQPVHMLANADMCFLLFVILFDSVNGFKNFFFWWLVAMIQPLWLFILHWDWEYYRRQTLFIMIQQLINLGMNDVSIVLNLDSVLSHVVPAIVLTKPISTHFSRKIIINTQCHGASFEYWGCSFNFYYTSSSCISDLITCPYSSCIFQV